MSSYKECVLLIHSCVVEEWENDNNWPRSIISSVLPS